MCLYEAKWVAPAELTQDGTGRPIVTCNHPFPSLGRGYKLMEKYERTVGRRIKSVYAGMGVGEMRVRSTVFTRAKGLGLRIATETAKGAVYTPGFHILSTPQAAWKYHPGRTSRQRVWVEVEWRNLLAIGTDCTGSRLAEVLIAEEMRVVRTISWKRMQEMAQCA